MAMEIKFSQGLESRLISYFIDVQLQILLLKYTHKV